MIQYTGLRAAFLRFSDNSVIKSDQTETCTDIHHDVHIDVQTNFYFPAVLVCNILYFFDLADAKQPNVFCANIRRPAHLVAVLHTL